MEARIVAVCDTWVAMLSHRAHRTAFVLSEARKRLERAAGRELDPEVVQALLALQDSDLAQLAATAVAV